MNKNNIIKKGIISVLIFVIFVAIVFYFIFRDNNYQEIYLILKNSKKIYLIIAILCMASFSISEALILKRALKLCGSKVRFKDAYKYAISGFFASSVTPGSSGGDPMQIYLMTKDKIPISHSAITLLTKLLCFEVITVVIGGVSYFSNPSLFSKIGNIKYIVYLGIFLNTLVLTLYILVIFYNKIVKYLVKLLERLLLKLKYKKTDTLISKINTQVIEYGRVAKTLRKNKLVFLEMLLITLIQMILYYSIPYLVYLSFGLRGVSLSTFIIIQSVLFVSVSALPFPGAVGISEGTFMYLYKNIYGSNLLGSAMVITRFINFYIFVFYSSIITLIVLLKENWRKK